MEARIPLTLQQRFLWSLMQAHRNWNCTATYAFRLRGALNLAVLQRSLDEVLKRHGSLRARISVDDEVIWQQAEELTADSLEPIQVKGASAVQIEENAHRDVEERCAIDLRPGAGPLWSACLLRLNREEHWLVLSLHRLLGDCAAIDQMYREVSVIYDALLEHRHSSLLTPAQYSDYALSQHKTCGEWVQRHQPYWQEYLANLLPLQWPSDPDCASAGNAPASPGAIGKMNCALGEELSVGLRELGRKAATLAATVMMAVYVAVLWKWCQQSEFVLPFNTTGRQTQYRSTIGFFSFVLYLRIRVTGRETFRELLTRLSKGFFATLVHQDYGRLALSRPELLSGAIYQWITWHPEDSGNTPDPTRTDPVRPTIERINVRDFGEGLTIVPPEMTAVEVTFFDTPQGIQAFGTYQASRFAAKTMARFMADLRVATELFVCNPDARLEVLAESATPLDDSAPDSPRLSQVERIQGVAQCQ